MGQQTIGKYRILDDIASGTQGAVFRAFDPESQRIVALKVLHATLIQDQTYIDRFHREASLTASVDHPNVVNIYDVGTVGTQHYIALEFLPETLGGLIESGALPLINAAGLAAGIADGLGAVHELGIVHRDLKPQNVLITPDGTPKVTDFGIARGGTLSTMTATGMIMGTPFYMSPEQAEGNRVDARADVYALGCVLYEMLAGEVPFTGATPFSVIRKHIETTARPIRTIQGEVPQLLAEVIEKAMSKSANDRYANGAEMAQAIRSAVPGIQSVEVAPPRPIVAAPEPPPPPAPAARPPPSPPLSARTIAYISSRSRSSQLLLSLAAAAIIAIVAALATLIATGSGGGSSTRATPLVAAVTPTSTVVAEAAAVTTLPSPAPMPTIVPVAPSPTLIPATPSPVPVPAPTTAATPTAALVPTTSPTMAPPTATSLPDTPAPPPTVAPSESVWVPTGSMAGTRRDHAAILLNDGTVLIVGGTSASAERYHPDTGAFSFLGNVPFNQGVRAARLSDGSVLVVGQGANPSAMTYDPSTTEFALTGSLSIARSNSSATLLPDGKVLVAGGQEGVAEGPQSLHVAELYDPATGLFTLTGNLNDHRSGHAAVALPNGKVLIVGGTQTTTPGFGINLTTVELYDPATGTFKIIGDTLSAHTSLSFGGVELLGNGKVLIVGGNDNRAELFDPVSGKSTATGNLAITRRSAHSSILLPDGQILLAGGSTGGGPIVTNSAELYDPVSGTFRLIESMNEGRQQHTATLLPNGNVLIVGGFSGERENEGIGSEINLSTAELWNLGSTLAPMPTPTPTPTGPTPTPTAAVPTPAPTPFPLPVGVIAQGLFEVSAFEAVDLDRGKFVPDTEEADMGHEFVSNEERFLFPYAGAGIVMIGPDQPGQAGCKAAVHSPFAININDVPEETYFCVITRDGNNSELRLITNVSGPGSYVQFTYTTWSS